MQSYFNTKIYREGLVREALEWEGTRFMFNARIKGKVVSCHNLIIGIYEEMGITLDFASPHSQGAVHDQETLREIHQFFQDKRQFWSLDIESQRLEPGDIVSFLTPTGNHHLGMYLGLVAGQNHTLLSSLPKYGVSRANLYDPSFSENVTGAFRLKPKNLW